jgi:hypothetical protein
VISQLSYTLSLEVELREPPRSVFVNIRNIAVAESAGRISCVVEGQGSIQCRETLTDHLRQLCVCGYQDGRADAKVGAGVEELL